MPTLLAAVLLAAAPAADPQPADLVLKNARVVTVDPEKLRAEAVAIRGDRIAAVGTNEEIAPHIGPRTRVLDLDGRTVVPGFIESHGHLMSLGRSKQVLDLRRARSWDDVVEIVRQAAKAPPGEWIVGRGWHQGKWDRPPEPNVEGYPVHASLSRVSPDHPVLLEHATGHMCFANAKAMQLAGVTDRTPDPAGGTILRDTKGNATGAFRESAQSLIDKVKAASPDRRSDERREFDELEAVQLAIDECLAKGVTSFQDAGSSFEEVERFRRLASEGKLGLRLWVMLSESNARLRERLAKVRVVGHGNNFLTVRAIKRMADGALGSHGAWLLEPYADLPDSRGLVVQPLELIRETALIAAEHDCQLCTHAIGDRANREILDLYQSIFRSRPAKRAWRWRIEHAQHVHPDDFPRFAELGVIASMQANHATSDGPFVEARLGRRRAEIESYAWRSLLDAKARVINGTDVPVEDVDPILCFHAAVTRRMKDGRAFFPEQCMTRDEALRSYTLDAAYAAFEEDLKGSIAPGKLADLVVLSQNILEVPADEIPATRVLKTLVGGRIVYEAP